MSYDTNNWREVFTNILWERVLKIEDKKLQEFIIHLLRFELQHRDEEKYRYTEEYMRYLKNIKGVNSNDT